MQNPNNSNRTFSLLVRLSTAIGLVAILVSGCGSQLRAQKAPDFTLTDTKGEKFSLNQFKGKVVFLEFWATWCPPCLMSMPMVEKLEEEYGSKGVEFISLSVDTDESAFKDFVNGRSLRGHVALATPDVQNDYGIRGIPAMYVIDQEGIVTRMWEGFAPSLAGLWRKELDRLLKS